jgi:HAD superfamily hydrolase (TIGR01509 family)
MPDRGTGCTPAPVSFTDLIRMFSARRAAILDVDGTLVDSNHAHARAWQEAFAEAGLQVPYDPIRRAIGMGGDKLMPLVSGIEEDSPQGRQIADRRAEIFKTRYLPELRPFPGVRDLLERLSESGFVLTVASSATADELGPLLEIAGVSDLISARTSSSDADESKPDPDIVAAALKRSGAPARAAVMLGDTPYDVEAAGRAGVRVVGLECGGWARDSLAGAVEIYRDPEHLHIEWARSIFAALVSEGDASGRRPAIPRPSPWWIAVPLAIAGAMLVARAVSSARRSRRGRPRLSARDRRALDRIIRRTS